MHRPLRSLAFGSWALLGALTAWSGCSEDRWDCHDICKTVQECLRVDVDLSACTGACIDYATLSTGAEARVEACNDCLDVLDVNSCNNPSSCEGLCDFVVAPVE